MFTRSGWSFLAGVLLTSLGCTGKPMAEGPPPAPTVSVASPLQQEVSDTAQFTGRTEAVQQVEIRARVSGYLVNVNFKDGADVEAGTLLFEIDPRPYAAVVASAEAEVARAQAAQQLAEANMARAQKLQPTRAITQEEFDRVVAEQAVAVAAVQGAQAAVANAKLDLEFTRVTAPITGRLSKTEITVGNLVTKDSTLLTTMVTVEPMYCNLDVDERTMLAIQQGIREGRIMSARQSDEVPIFLALAGEVGFPHEGRLNFVDNRLDPATGTLRVRSVFDNRERVLSPGLFCRLQFPLGPPRRALLVSQRAILTDQGRNLLLVVGDDNTVQARPVTLGGLFGNLRAIESGLSPQEQIVVNGLQRVRPGMKVLTSPVPMPGNESLPATPPPTPANNDSSHATPPNAISPSTTPPQTPATTDAPAASQSGSP